MTRAVEGIACNSMVRLCVVYAALFAIAITDALQNRYCSMNCEYDENLTFAHTVCERGKEKCAPASRCGKEFRVIDFGDDVRQFLLDLHNELRNKVAMGKETRGSPGRQPSAADMKILKYNRELEFIAQCWANTCQGKPLVHDHCRSAKNFEYVGQNLGFYSKSNRNIDLKQTLRSLVMYWYDEVETFNREWVNYTDDRGPQVKVGHYTQMLWSDTTDIGCAASYYTTKPEHSNTSVKKWHNVIFVCNYAPGGNYISLPVYNVGKPSSDCVNGMRPNKKYPGLCGSSRRVNETHRDYVPLFNF